MATSKSGRVLSVSRTNSQVYPTEPRPMHFTQLLYPKVMPPPATYKKPRKSTSRLLGCCCCSIFATLCSLFFTIALLLGLATLITWLVLRPIHSPKFSVETLQLKTFNVSTPQGNLNHADVLYTVVASNSNGKLGFKYDVIAMETSYGGQIFGRSEIPAFSQGHRNVTTLTSGFVVENFAFVPASVGSTLAMDVHERGNVALHAKASAKVRVKVGVITTFAIRVHVNCDFILKVATATSPASVITKTCKLTR